MPKKKEDFDTETTFANMDIDGFSWHGRGRRRTARGDNEPEKEKIRVTKKESRAMMRGAFSAMLPLILCIVVGFVLAFLLVSLWLSPK